jgi:bisphosphoglycerate-dependent phosphoglycerate mutase
MAQPRSYAEITKRNLPQTEDKIGTNRNFSQRPSTPEIYTNECYTRNIQYLEMAHPRNYAETTKRNLPQTEDTTNILTKFLDEFKNLIQQLIQQNTMVLNMLTMLVNKTK